MGVFYDVGLAVMVTVLNLSIAMVPLTGMYSVYSDCSLKYILIDCLAVADIR